MKKKKTIAALLALCMTAGVFAGCSEEASSGSYSGATEVTNDYDLITVEGSDHQYKKYKDMTEENITLTYFHFDQNETVDLLATFPHTGTATRRPLT